MESRPFVSNLKTHHLDNTQGERFELELSPDTNDSWLLSSAIYTIRFIVCINTVHNTFLGLRPISNLLSQLICDHRQSQLTIYD